eukprot:7560764-Pyramimonas_sp.AAC.1
MLRVHGHSESCPAARCPPGRRSALAWPTGIGIPAWFRGSLGKQGPLEGAIDQLNTAMVDAFADAARK